MAAFDGLGAAREVAACFAGEPGLRMVLVTGSAARGLSDESSDLDVYLYWDDVDATRLAADGRLAALGATRVFGVPTVHGWFEKHRRGDRYVDVESVAMATLEAAAAALRTPMLPGWVTKLAAGLRDAVAVAGADELRRWQAELAFTDELVAAEIAARASRLVAPSAIYELTFARGDVLAFVARLAPVLLDVIALLGAANREFVPVDDPMWLPWHIGRLTDVPPDTVRRIDAALRQPSAVAMADLDLLVQQTLDIVEADVGPGGTRRARFATALRPRPADAGPPPHAPPYTS